MNFNCVFEKVDLAVEPAAAWSMVGDFMAWQAWHPAFLDAALLRGQPNTKGSVRLLTGRGGVWFKDELVAYDRKLRVCEYRVIQSPLPVDRQFCTLQVQPREGAWGSTVVWASIFTMRCDASRAEVERPLKALYREGLDSLAMSLEFLDEKAL